MFQDLPTVKLTLMLPAVISWLAFVDHGMPHEESVINGLAPSKRDNSANYVVYPKDSTNKEQAAAITALLKSILSDPTQIYISSTNIITAFWAVPLTSDNAQKVRADSNVRMCSHLRSKGLHTHEPRSLQLFKNAPQITPIQQIADAQDVTCKLRRFDE